MFINFTLCGEVFGLKYVTLHIELIPNFLKTTRTLNAMSHETTVQMMTMTHNYIKPAIVIVGLTSSCSILAGSLKNTEHEGFRPGGSVGGDDYEETND